MTSKHQTIKKGSTGADVGEFQALVNSTGIRPQLKVDKDFGEQSATAAKKFQRKHKLTADGIVGPETWAKLLKVTAKPAAKPTPKPTPTPAPKPDKPASHPKPDPLQDGVLMYLETGAAVKHLHERLVAHGAPSSLRGGQTFSSATEKAVRAFQERYHLEVDGIAGPITLTALKSKPGEVIKSPPKQPTTVPSGFKSRVYARSAISLRSPNGSGSRVKWSKSSEPVVHYPAMTDAVSTVAQAMRALRGFQSYHMKAHGWSDIAYHVAFDQAGNTYHLRAEETRGAHTGNAKGTRIHTGDANQNPGLLYLITNNEAPSALAISAVKQYCKNHGLDYDRIRAHNELDWTGCPGRKVARIHGRPYNG